VLELVGCTMYAGTLPDDATLAAAAVEDEAGLEDEGALEEETVLEELEGAAAEVDELGTTLELDEEALEAVVVGAVGWINDVGGGPAEGALDELLDATELVLDVTGTGVPVSV
jgi:hypothetical protein